VVVHEHTGGDVHGADQHEPLGYPALGQDLLELRREVHELTLFLGVKGQVLGVGFHALARAYRLVCSSVMRIVERALAAGARVAWPLVERFNARFERPSPRPSWAPGPLPKRRERTSPEF